MCAVWRVRRWSSANSGPRTICGPGSRRAGRESRQPRAPRAPRAAGPACTVSRVPAPLAGYPVFMKTGFLQPGLDELEPVRVIQKAKQRAQPSGPPQARGRAIVNRIAWTHRRRWPTGDTVWYFKLATGSPAPRYMCVTSDPRCVNDDFWRARISRLSATKPSRPRLTRCAL